MPEKNTGIMEGARLEGGSERGDAGRAEPDLVLAPVSAHDPACRGRAL